MQQKLTQHYEAIKFQFYKKKKKKALRQVQGWHVCGLQEASVAAAEWAGEEGVVSEGWVMGNRLCISWDALE